MRLFGNNISGALFMIVISGCFYIPSHAQTSCATITNVSANTIAIESKKPFKCSTQVTQQFAGSEDVACGISINGEFPTDACPSDEFFGGWQGNKAQFNCVFPYDSIATGSTVELVAYDFRPECGPTTGKRIALDTSKIPQIPANQPTPSSSKPSKDIALDVLRLFFSFNTGRTIPSQSKPTHSPVVLLTPVPTLIPTTYPLPSNALVPSVQHSAQLKNMVSKCTNNISVYQQAAQYTGIPWYVLAGIHYREGECGATASLVSGRQLGTNEPDIYGNCTSQRAGIGIPQPLPGGGCGFDSLLSSAVYAGNHLKSKIGKTPTTFQELTLALSRYNGGGNSNCGKTPYKNCPRKFAGEDDTYVMNLFDTLHTPMYIVYCADYTLCNPPVVDRRPGTATAATILFNNP